MTVPQLRGAVVEHLQNGDCISSLGSLCQRFTTLSEDDSLTIPNLTLPRCDARPFPLTLPLGEEANPHLATTSFQVIEESGKVSPEPPLLRTEQAQFPQLLPAKPVLQTPHSFVVLLWTPPRVSTSFL